MKLLICLLAVITAVIIASFDLIVSWAITCMLVYCICLCFDWAFSLAVATGIWLVIPFIRYVIRLVIKVLK